MIHRAWRTCLAAAIATACASAQQPSASQGTALDVKAIGGKTFYVDDQAGSNQITFLSQSTIEDFTGVCNKVRGTFTLDPRCVESLAGAFAIRVEDMKTGIELRDTHMRGEDWLDAAKYPEIRIDVTSVEAVKKTGDNAATLTLVGTCSLHGKRNAVRIPATLTYLDESPRTQQKVKGDLVKLRAEFKLKLSDYAVTGPKASEMIGLKVADEIEIKATIFGSTQPPPKPLEKDVPASAPSSGTAVKPAPPKP